MSTNQDGEMFVHYKEEGIDSIQICKVNEFMIRPLPLEMNDVMSIGDLICFKMKIGRIACVRDQYIDIACMDGSVSGISLFMRNI